ncbi:hypothetical protein ACIOHC_37910 [Streptomyces sp. NPDC088252]|uniref:hypothetical protein n=1 Tax=unclassified Streptomyces TaxID=2593676 RepID=UPI00381DE40B
MTNDFGWHTYSPHSDLVARYLRTGEYLDPALEALARFTRYFSAEVAVRDFLNNFPDETMKAIDAGARDLDHRTRRLASEATCPLLPLPRASPCLTTWHCLSSSSSTATPAPTSACRSPTICTTCP